MTRASKCGPLRLLLGIAAMATGLASPANADIIGFSPTGTGTFTPVTGLQFAAGDVLIGNAITSGGTINTAPGGITVDYQVPLVSLLTSTGPVDVPGLNTTFQIAEVGSFRETATVTGSTATLTAVPGSGTSTIYFNGSKVYDLAAGTGFTTGTPILTKSPTIGTGTFNASLATIVQFNQNGTGDYTGINAAFGTGSATNTFRVAPGYNPLFFEPASPLITTSQFNSGVRTFFTTIPPPLVLETNTGGTVTPMIGATNGVSGPDILMEGSGITESFTAVPEPASFTVAATALGIVPLAAFALRRRAKATLA